MKNNNKGFSLVEFIVVIAIASILGAVSLGALNTAYNARSKKAAEILYSAMQECKLRNLTGEECYLKITLNTRDKMYHYSIIKNDNTVIDTGTVGNSRLTIKFSKTVTSSRYLKFTFNKKTGGLSAWYNTTSISGTQTLSVSGVGKTRSFKIYKNTGYICNITVS